MDRSSYKRMRSLDHQRPMSHRRPINHWIKKRTPPPANVSMKNKLALNLVDWFAKQEIYFNENGFKSDLCKVKHVVLNLHVHYWSVLERIFIENKPEVNYDQLKKGLVDHYESTKPTKSCESFNQCSTTDNTNTRLNLDLKSVNAYVNQLNIRSINLTSLTVWLLKLRGLTNGRLSDVRLISTIFEKIEPDQRNDVFGLLINEIQQDVNHIHSSGPTKSVFNSKDNGQRRLTRLYNIKVAIQNFVQFDHL